jgi:hypothetical protein
MSAPPDNKPSADSGAPLDLTEYEAGFVDGYLAARGIFDAMPREFQRALAALKKSREKAADAQTEASTEA